ncbi:redoxin domain-containing protein [Pimelobacter simplex]|uniref:Glutathione peroxidase n=1 Tax=Nocardioides simplex TaxID=2045 RepID=A0A0A1DGK2_NOCSI|nr:glutathione peroxidase [Pimelobacter simplex]AIY15643.1 Glutathione peroxidase family protein [Pimelobacter simplex]MCG8150585.1 redoxin domain-containing protein [Pimelobacter simplex]GEB15107.1 glutathione peroxidase [Pimelobacter simplex]SFM86318.1 glutathione peroxidase [Pimelobacter simplex]
MTNLHDFAATGIDGQEIDLSSYDGSVVLVVNTASKCGFTPQYQGLQELHDTYGERGFTVLGFPCDQFAHQEPGTDDEIAAFCERNYGVSFPMFAKVEVNGKGAHPLYRWLKDQKGGLIGGAIKWNFTKFLIGRDGTVLDRYAPTTEPAKISGDIEQALA